MRGEGREKGREGGRERAEGRERRSNGNKEGWFTSTEQVLSLAAFHDDSDEAL